MFCEANNLSTKREVVAQLQTLTQLLLEWHVVTVDPEENVARWLINKNRVGWMRS